MIVLDTNVASELMRPSPDVLVREWIRVRRGEGLRTTAITLAEIRYGIERLPAGRRRERLKMTADDVFAAFAARLLPFDREAAAQYGPLVVGRERAGRPIDVVDAQIASICRSRGAALATRNVRDFDATGIEVVDPWDAR